MVCLISPRATIRNLRSDMLPFIPTFRESNRTFLSVYLACATARIDIHGPMFLCHRLTPRSRQRQVATKKPAPASPLRVFENNLERKSVHQFRHKSPTPARLCTGFCLSDFKTTSCMGQQYI